MGTKSSTFWVFFYNLGKFVIVCHFFGEIFDVFCFLGEIYDIFNEQGEFFDIFSSWAISISWANFVSLKHSRY